MLPASNSHWQLDASAANAARLTFLKPAPTGDPSVFSAQDLSGDNFSSLAVVAPDHRCLIVAQVKPGGRAQSRRH